MEVTEVSLCATPRDLFDAASGWLPGEACDAIELRTPSGTSSAGVDCRPIDPSMLGQGQPCAVGGGSDDDHGATVGTCEPI